MSTKCPHCRGDLNIGQLLGKKTSPAKVKSSRENAKLGGWPKGKPRKKKKRSSANNDSAASVR